MGIAVKAYGKINIFLDCLRKRDDGYHEVKMIMQSVRLHDLVEIREADKNSVFTDSLYVPNNKNNLAMKAANLLQEKGAMPPVAIKIKKNIPVSAGMAGGSTDAAAVLVGCNELFHLGFCTEELMRLAAEIGSDVPFCVLGGTAIATGRGEIVEALPELPKMHVVLAPADYGVSTVSVYKAIRPKDLHPEEEKYRALCQAVQKGNCGFIASHLYNFLEKPSFRIEPRTKARKEALLEAGVTNVLMSGSGPTLFGMYDSEKEAWENYKKMRTVFPNVYLTSTCSFDLINSRLCFQ